MVPADSLGLGVIRFGHTHAPDHGDSEGKTVTTVAKAVHELPMSIERLHFYGTSACCQKYEKNTTMCKLIFCICSNFQIIYCLISHGVKIKQVTKIRKFRILVTHLIFTLQLIKQ